MKNTNIMIGNYEFTGTSFPNGDLPDKAGVYAFLRPVGRDYQLIDMGYHSSLKSATLNAGRDVDNISLAVLFVDSDHEADKILAELEAEYGCPDE